MNLLKQTYIDRAEKHYTADEIVQGIYWKNGKGCRVGCLSHDGENAHFELEKQTNIPEWLSCVADTIHEGLTEEESKSWPVRFIKAVPVKVFTKEWSAIDIAKKIKAPFLIMVLESTLETFDHNEYPDVKSAVDGSITLWKRDDFGSDDWRAAAAPTRAAAKAAAKAAAAAAAAVEEAAEASAWAMWAAEAAVAAANAAAAAVEEAAEAAAVEAAEAGVRKKKYTYFADQLISIMEQADV